MTQLSRRRFIAGAPAAAVTGLAGCLSGRSPRAGKAEVPDVSFTAAVRRPFTNEHPAGLQLELDNPTDDPLLFLAQEGPGQSGLFRPVRGSNQSSDAELLLLRTDGLNCRSDTGTPSAIPATPTDHSTGDGCWRPPCEQLITYHVEPAWQELGQDASMTDKYVLLDGFNESCLPADTYTFTATGRIAHGELTADGQPRFDSRQFILERTLTVSITEDLGVTVSTAVAITEPSSSG